MQVGQVLELGRGRVHRWRCWRRWSGRSRCRVLRRCLLLGHGVDLGLLISDLLTLGLFVSLGLGALGARVMGHAGHGGHADNPYTASSSHG
jgi:hypothetical protein